MAFRRLWIGQLVSNLGTQTCLYALALWLFKQEARIGGVVTVAVVVQLAKVAIMPLVSRWLPHWPRRRVMVVSNVAATISTLSLVACLAQWGEQLPSFGVIPLLAIAAAAEAVLVLCLSTLVAVIVPPEQWPAVNGWIAAGEGVVNLASPFLGALMVQQLGLVGIALLDGASTTIALLSVCWGRWPALALARTSSWAGTDAGGRQRPGSVAVALGAVLRRPLTSALLWLGAGMMASCAAIEVLFPAWLLVGLPSEILPQALMFSAVLYSAGLLFWQRLACRDAPRWLILGLLVQAMLLVASIWEWFQLHLPIWLLGAAAFNFAVPIVNAALQTLWQRAIPVSAQVKVFAARYSVDWSARLAGFLLAGQLSDRWISPGLQAGLLPGWMGQGHGRSMAISLACMGVGQLIIVAWNGPVLLRSILQEAARKS